MLPLRVVPALDEVDDRHPRLGLAAEAPPVQGREEALAERVEHREGLDP